MPRTSTRTPASHQMTPAERGASISMAAVFALRMLGLFIVLPVFMLEAGQYRGGSDPALMGLALGAYGLTQAFFQAPLGVASDRFGRKKVIVLGLIVFAVGSVIAAVASDVHTLIVGRAVQGAGAISAAVTALLADLTRDAVRTKAMALVGVSIGLTFAVSLAIAPPLAGWVGLSGLFVLTAVLALLGIVAVLWWTPPEPRQQANVPRGRLADVWRHPALWRLHLSVFLLHSVQMAMWVVVPGLLVAAGLPKAAQWQVYLPTVLLSFVLMVALFAAERGGHLSAMWRGSIVLFLLVQLAFLVLAPRAPGLWAIGVVLFCFFVAFNILEATLPSLVSRLAPPHARGAALGVYNTMQSIGLFVGGALGGWVLKNGGVTEVFVAATVLAVLWLLLGWAQPMPERTPRPNHVE